MFDNYAPFHCTISLHYFTALFQDDVFLTFWQFRLTHWFFKSFFVSQRWAGMERIQPAEPSHCHSERCQVRRPDDNRFFFRFCLRDYLGHCRLYAKSDLVLYMNLKVWTTLDIWSSKIKTSNFGIDPPGWRLLQTSQFSRESITVTSSPRTGSLMISSNFFKTSKLSVTISHILLNVRTQTNPI